MGGVIWRKRMGWCVVFALAISALYAALPSILTIDYSWLRLKPTSEGQGFEVNFHNVFFVSINGYLVTSNIILAIDLLFGPLSENESIDPVRGPLAIGVMAVIIFTFLKLFSLFFVVTITFFT